MTLRCQKEEAHSFKAIRKNTKIFSEISNFFQGKQQSALLQAYSSLVDRLNLSSKMLGGVKKPNCKLTNLQIFHILLFMPFFRHQRFLPLCQPCARSYVLREERFVLRLYVAGQCRLAKSPLPYCQEDD